MKILTKRIPVFILALAIEIAFFYALFSFLGRFEHFIEIGLAVYSVLLVLYIVSKQEEATYRILWLLVILTLPLAGSFLYLIMGNRRAGKKLREAIDRSEETMPREMYYERYAAIGESGARYLPAVGKDMEAWQDLPPASQQILQKHGRLAKTLARVEQVTGYPLQENLHARYYPIGEELYAKMLEELEKAEKYIYCEYFIINHGKMWDQMEEIMARKAAKGVDVRVMYDDLGSLTTFSPKEVKRLAQRKIKCVRFNPIHFILGRLNYRDHRKMLIIDGLSAFSGGVNIADEYINEIERFGHWKDIGFWITGPAVENYTHMFVKFWNAISEDRISSTMAKALPIRKRQQETKDFYQLASQNTDGLILSYYDSPVKEEHVSNDLYIDLLYQAKDYIWFCAPYLLPGASLLEALQNAGKRGVDVRIIVPGIPDKKMVFAMTRSYYEQLMDVGVKIYEYTPGFVHAKGCVMDDYLAAVGTVNLDYRSLFLHYENNSIFLESQMVAAVKEDMLHTMQISKEQKIQEIRKGFIGYIKDALLRIVAPLC